MPSFAILRESSPSFCGEEIIGRPNALVTHLVIILKAYALDALSTLLAEIEVWTPGFSGAILFHGKAALPVVSLIRSGNQEAMRSAAADGARVASGGSPLASLS